MISSLLSSKLLVPKYPELATEIIQSAMTDPVLNTTKTFCSVLSKQQEDSLCQKKAIIFSVKSTANEVAVKLPLSY